MQVVEGGDDLDRVKQRRRRVEPAGTENGGSASFAPQNVRVPMWHVVSVTRFGKILMVYLLFGKLLSLLWQICYIIVLIFIVVK